MINAALLPFLVVAALNLNSFLMLYSPRMFTTEVTKGLRNTSCRSAYVTDCIVYKPLSDRYLQKMTIIISSVNEVYYLFMIINIWLILIISTWVSASDIISSTSIAPPEDHAMAESLVVSAFGSGASLYDALRVDRKAPQVNLKKAFRKRALEYHPDRHSGQNSTSAAAAEGQIEEMTLKFQAVSAAYEILMDPRRRSIYDLTGKIDDIYDDHDHSHGGGTSDVSSSRDSSRRRHAPYNAKANQNRWEEFFRSVFDEVISGGSEYGNATTFRGSDKEAEDVLKFWELCKGDIDKVLNCVVHGEDENCKNRWMKEIIQPAINRGEIEEYSDGRVKIRPAKGRESSALFDSDDDVDDDDGRKYRIKKSAKKKIRKKRLGKTKNLGRSKKSSVPIARGKEVPDLAPRSGKMNKKDKMEYRVAKKRKRKAEREIEIAELYKSKQWTGVNLGQGQDRRVGTFNASLIASLEKKYSGKQS